MAGPSEMMVGVKEAVSESDPGHVTELAADENGVLGAGLVAVGLGVLIRAAGVGVLIAVPDPPLELTMASKPDASTDASDVRTTVSLVPDDVRVVPLPSEPLNRPSIALPELSPSYTVRKSYAFSVFIAVICKEIVDADWNVHRQFWLEA